MFPLIVPLAMAAAGALIDKKQPLRGALIGGSLGFGGAGLLGGAGAAGGAGAGAGAGSAFAAPSASTLASVNLPASTSMFPSAASFMNTAGTYMKPISTGLSIANSTGLLGGQQQPIQPSPVMQNTGMGGSSLSQLYGQLQQNDMNQQQAELQRRAKQRELIARMGGNYGRIA